MLWRLKELEQSFWYNMSWRFLPLVSPWWKKVKCFCLILQFFAYMSAKTSLMKPTSFLKMYSRILAKLKQHSYWSSVLNMLDLHQRQVSFWYHLFLLLKIYEFFSGMFYQEKKCFPTTQSLVRKWHIISLDLKTQPPLQSLHRRWHSLHMKPVFNAPASAAAAGNGWYMLYNHRGRENPHFSAEPSTENTDRKHSNHVKDRDAAESQTEDRGWKTEEQAGDELDQQSHLSDLYWSLIRLCNHRVLALRRRVKERGRKHSCESPLVCFVWGLASRCRI